MKRADKTDSLQNLLFLAGRQIDSADLTSRLDFDAKAPVFALAVQEPVIHYRQ